MTSRAISVRLDDESRRALTELTRNGGDQSDAVRAALVESAARRRKDGLAEEAAALACNEADRAEMENVAALMESLRAPR